MNNRHTLALVSVLTVLVAACGGGGSSNPNNSGAQSTTSYPLVAAYEARVKSGASDVMMLSGGCTGSSVMNTSAAQAASTSTGNAWTANQTMTVVSLDCPAIDGTKTASITHNTNFVPIINSVPGAEYAWATTINAALPTAVTIGASGQIATLTVYSNDTKTVVQGSRVLSYSIASDSDNSALVDFKTMSYSAAGQLQFTQHTRYRLSSTGTLHLLNIEIQFASGGISNLLFTKVN